MKYAGRTIHPSLYATAQIVNPDVGRAQGDFVRVVGQDAASKDDVRELLLLCADGVRRWYDIDEVKPCL